MLKEIPKGMTEEKANALTKEQEGHVLEFKRLADGFKNLCAEVPGDTRWLRMAISNLEQALICANQHIVRKGKDYE